MSNEYKEAKNLILEKWWTFRNNINDYLPDNPYKGLARPSYYTYYSIMNVSHIEYLSKQIHDFADIITGTVMQKHVGYEVADAVRNFDESAKTNDILQVLTATWEAFKVFRTTVLVLERLG